MNKNELWTLAQEATQALGVRYGPAMEKTAAAAGVESPAWHLLLPALLFEPDPVSAEQLRVRMPYNAATSYNERLAQLEQWGLLVPVNESQYCLTDTGYALVRRIIEAAYATMAALQPMPEAELEHMAALSLRIVESSEAAPEPPGKWSIILSRRIELGEDAPAVVRIDQYLSDLNAYRDDAHLAAWQPHNISGSAWEAFTLLWRDEAATLEELCLKLAHRGFERAAYAEALSDLIGRGWIEQDEDRYQVTKVGQSIREVAEQTTEHYFFVPWACLSKNELGMLKELLIQLRDGLL